MIQVGDSNANPVFTDVVQQTQSLAALNATNSVQLRGQASATVQVTGIGSLTLTFEGSTDGSNFDPIFATPIAGGTAVSSTTANGHWIGINTTGLSVFRVRVSAFTSGSATVSVIASQGSPPGPFSTNGCYRIDLISVNGTTLGTPANFGTSPGAVVAENANASMFVGTTAVRTNQATTAAGVVDINLVGLLGTTAVAAAAGIIKVGVSGATGVTLDGTAAVGTSPTNGLLTLSENVTTAPSLATGQSVSLQSDYQGSVFIKPYRRGQTGAQASSIVNVSTAVTCVTAQAAGIFADIASLILTVLPTTATAPVIFTVTLSDGTRSFVFDLTSVCVGVSTTAPSSVTDKLIASFDPPLPASSAATAWTITASVATVTVHCTIGFVLQKAS